MESTLEFIKFELMDLRSSLEQNLNKIPIDQREPIIRRIKRLKKVIHTLSFYCSIEKGDGLYEKKSVGVSIEKDTKFQ